MTAFTTALYSTGQVLHSSDMDLLQSNFAYLKGRNTSGVATSDAIIDIESDYVVAGETVFSTGGVRLRQKETGVGGGASETITFVWEARTSAFSQAAGDSVGFDFSATIESTASDKTTQQLAQLRWMTTGTGDGGAFSLAVVDANGDMGDPAITIDSSGTVYFQSLTHNGSSTTIITNLNTKYVNGHGKAAAVRAASGAMSVYSSVWTTACTINLNATGIWVIFADSEYKYISTASGEVYPEIRIDTSNGSIGSDGLYFSPDVANQISPKPARTISLDVSSVGTTVTLYGKNTYSTTPATGQFELNAVLFAHGAV